MISKSCNEYKKLVTLLKVYEFKNRTHWLINFFLYLSTSFLISLHIIWLTSYIFVSLNSYILENIFIFLFFSLIFPIFFRFKNIFLRFKKKKYSEIARDIEKHNNLNGRLISSADFIENEYKHNRELEFNYIKTTLNDISKTKFSTPHTFTLTKIIPLLSLLIVFIALSIFFKYSPLKYLKETLFYNKIKITYTLDYPKEIENGKKFILKIKTFAKSVSTETGFSLNNLKTTFLERNNVLNSNNKIKTWFLTIQKVTRDFYVKLTFIHGRQAKLEKVLKIRVFSYPAIKKITLMYQPPPFYLIKRKIFYDTGNIEGFKNSIVKIKFDFTNKLKTARIHFHKSNKSYDMKVLNNTAEYTFRIGSKEEYSIRIIDVFNHKNLSPPVYHIIPLTDNPPTMSIIYPNKDIISKNTNYFKVKLKASDDYGLHNLLVEMIKYSSPDLKKVIFKRNKKISLKRALQINREFKVSLYELTPNPGEVLKYRISIFDIKGQKIRSNWFKITFPSLYQRIRSLDRERQNIAETLNKILNKQRKIKQELLALEQKIRMGTLTAEDKKRMKQLLKKQRALFKLMQNQSYRIQKMSNTIRNNPNIKNKQLASRLKEINKLLKDVLSKEALKALKKMRMYLNQMNNRSQINQFSSPQDVQRFINRLNKTIAMLRKLKNYQRLINVKILLKEMLRIVKTIKNTQNLALKNQLNITRIQAISELNRISLPNIQEALKIFKKQLKGNIKHLVTSIEKNTLAKTNALNIQLTDMIKKIDKLLKKIGGGNFSLAMKYLNRLIYEMIELSKRFNSFKQELNFIKNQFPIVKDKFLMNSLYKKWLTKLQFVRTTIKKRYEKFPFAFEGILRDSKPFVRFMEVLFNTINDISKMLVKKNYIVASIKSKNYYRQHNYFILMLLHLQKQMLNAKKRGSGQSNQNLNSLAEMQRQLNKQVKRLWGKARQGQLSQGEREYLNRLARKQNNLANQIDKLSNQNSETARRLKRLLQEIRREMREVARNLHRQRLNSSTIRRQQRILRRMLEGSRGLESRERERNRRGEAVINDDFSENAEIRRAFNEYMRRQKPEKKIYLKNLSPYYKKLLKQYFKTLKKLLTQ